MSSPRPVGRFAPSPTGPLHMGSLVAAMASYLDVRSRGGRWLLRIDDIDQTRARPAFADEMLRTLAAFGLHWDELTQPPSQRVDRYAWAFRRLQATSQLYPCTCTRREIAQAGLVGLEGPRYPGTCRSRSLTDVPDAAWRIAVPDEQICFDDRFAGRQCQDLGTDIGDFVIRRADGGFAYHLGVVVDDADQGVTEVLRGADLLASTPRQIFLADQLGLPAPEYAHVSLVRDDAGRKLSKQDGAHPVDPNHPLPALTYAHRFLKQCPVPATITNPKDFWACAIQSWDPIQLRVVER